MNPAQRKVIIAVLKALKGIERMLQDLIKQ
jgi:hypothetical protein